MKEFGLKIIMTLSFLLLGFVCFIVPEPVRGVLGMFLPGLFFGVLAGVVCGGLYGAAVGAGLPVAVCLLLKTVEWRPDTLTLVISFVLAALAAGLLYRIYKSAIGACLGAVLVSRIAYGVSMVVLGILDGRSYTLMEYLREAFVQVYPGLLLTLLLVPGFVHVMRKIRLMRLLGREE